MAKIMTGRKRVKTMVIPDSNTKSYCDRVMRFYQSIHSAQHIPIKMSMDIKNLAHRNFHNSIMGSSFRIETRQQ